MKKCKQGCDLKSCFFCRNSIREWLPLLQINRQTFSVGKGVRLFTEGDPVKGIYFIQKGRVKVHQRWTEEKELIVRFAETGAIVGHRGLGKEGHYPVSATTLEASTVCFVELDFFFATLKINTELMFKLLLFFAAELQESEQRMRNMARLPVKSRVAGALIFLEAKFGCAPEGHLDLSISRQDLAAYIGATYETVFRMLQELAGEGLVALNGKHIFLLNKQALAEKAEGI